jgi:uncharacterized membrane protein YecN with MAPEG domain
MIKTLFLIFLPIPTWEQIAALQRKVATVFFTFLLPLLLLSTAAECFGLIRWGKVRGEFGHLTQLPLSQAVVYGFARLLLSIIIVVVVAKLIKALGETFHGRHSFHQVFTVAAYALSPLFLVRMLNAFPGMSPWVSWCIGILLSIAVLYHGLPIILKPDPPHAFGLYFMSALLMTVVTGLVCFLTDWYLKGRFTKIDEVITKLASYLPL